MGSGISKPAKQLMFGITGVIQLGLYVTFLLSPADEIMKKGWVGIFMFISLIISGVISFLASFLPTNNCEWDDCDKILLKAIMIPASIVTTVMLFILLYTKFETTKVGMAIAFITLIVLTLFYAAYAIDFRGVICMCKPIELSATECNKLPECECT